MHAHAHSCPVEVKMWWRDIWPSSSGFYLWMQEKYLENKLCVEVQHVVCLPSFCCFFSSCSKAADILFPDFLPEPSIKSLATKCERLKREWLLNEEAALNYSEILPLPLFLFLMFWISSTFLAVKVFRKCVLKEQLQCVRVFETKHGEVIFASLHAV